MAHILCIDTSHKSCSVSLQKNEILLSDIFLNIDRSHSEKLLILIDILLNTAGVNKKNLDAIAISSGPGSYTGLRIGASIAKGLCIGLDIPLIEVKTLDSMADYAAGINYENYYLCPVLEARENEIYYGLYDHRGIRNITDQIENLDIDSFQDYKKAFINHNFSLCKTGFNKEEHPVTKGGSSDSINEEGVIFIGSGAKKVYEIISLHDAKYIFDYVHEAKHMMSISYKSFIEKEYVDIDTFEPNYIKAARNWKG